MSVFFVPQLRFGTKIQILCAALVFATSMLISAYLYNEIREGNEQRELSALQNVATLNAELLRIPFKLLAHDAELVAKLEFISDMVRPSGTAKGAVRADHQRLIERGFTYLLAARPHYDQARLIGLDDGGREIVRVQRSDEGIRIVPTAELQAKGQEPYMRELQTSDAPFLSSVTLNREHGAIDPRRLPTIRLVYPIRSRDGTPLGAVVLNADFEKMLQDAVVDMPGRHRLTVIESAGDFIEFDGNGSPPELHFRSDPDFAPSPLAQLKGDVDNGLGKVDDTLFYVTNIDVGTLRFPGDLRLVVSTESRHVQAPLVEALRSSMTVTIGLVALSCAIAWTAARVFTRPLTELSTAIAGHSNELEPLGYDIHSHDEIGILSTAFRDLTNSLIDQVASTVAIVESVANGIMSVNSDGTITQANRAAHDIFGADKDCLVGRNLADFLPEDIRDKHCAWMARVDPNTIGRLMAPNRVIYGIKLDGDRVELEISITMMIKGHERYFIGVIRDMSESRAAQERLKHLVRELEATQAELVRSNKELDNFAYLASHDLRAPLRAIKNASGWLEEDLGDKLDEESRKNLDLLHNRVNRMDRLLSDLLEHSRIGRVDHPPAEISGSELVENIRDLVHGANGLKIVASPALLSGTFVQMPLQTVLLNLVSNAMKHHDKSEGQILLDMATRADGLREFSVTDDGPGIAEKYHERIFDIFQTLRSRDQVEGSGMGLAMVKKYVSLAGGQIKVRSSLGAGSTFSFTWPDPTRAAATGRIGTNAA